MLQLFAKNYHRDQNGEYVFQKEWFSEGLGCSIFSPLALPPQGGLQNVQEPFKKTLLEIRMSGAALAALPCPLPLAQGSSLLFGDLLLPSHGDRMGTGSSCPTHGSQRDTEQICTKHFTS